MGTTAVNTAEATEASGSQQLMGRVGSALATGTAGARPSVGGLSGPA